MRAIYQRVYPQDMEATLAALIQEIERLKRQLRIQKGNKCEQLKQWRTKNPDKIKEQKKRWKDKTRQKVREQTRAGEMIMTQPPLVTMPTYTVETPCVVMVANTEQMRQPSQRTEPDGVKDTIPKEVLVGVVNPPKPVNEMTAETILARQQKDKMKAKRRQYDGNKARRQAYAKQYYHKNKNKIRERQKLCHRQKRNKIREILLCSMDETEPSCLESNETLAETPL